MAGRGFEGHLPYRRNIWRRLLQRTKEGRWQPRARVRSQIVESAWSPYRPTRRFGVHLASKSCGHKPFLFSAGSL